MQIYFIYTFSLIHKNPYPFLIEGKLWEYKTDHMEHISDFIFDIQPPIL